MTDSQENVLQQDNNQEEKIVENVAASAEVENNPQVENAQEAAETETETQTETANSAEETVLNEEEEKTEQEIRRDYASKQEVLERVKELAHGDENPGKAEVDFLKTVFYKLHIAEKEEKYKAYLEAGGDPESYQETPDQDEDTFKTEMGIIKEKRAKIFQEQENEKAENLKKKLEIIEKIKTMITSPEEANKSYNTFKELQQQWKEIKNVPAEQANTLWRNYQLYVEQFYDLLKLNSEAREYDFKKNLEIKTRICEAAEKLADEKDVISAFHQLQKLHQEFRETGPVSKELREEIWNRFKAASTVVNKAHQQHFEELRAREEENLNKKTELCEKVENIAKEENKNSADWERHTKEIIGLQTEWKTIGFAPQKMNVKIFERFRAACDDFFGRKAEYFKTLKETFAQNAEKKRALVEKAKELQDSTEWRKTGDKLIQLQKEWKTIGMVPKKLGDQLWEEFLGACNHFFEARNEATKGQRSEEHDNLDKKREIIEKLKALAIEAGDNLQENVQRLSDEFNAVGHVPFKEKDKIYKEFHDVMDQIYKDLKVSVTRRRLNNFKQNLKNVAKSGEDAILGERARLLRQYESIKQEVQTYENNIGFLSASSKKGNSLVDEMNKKIQKLRDNMQLVYDKIKAIDNRETEEEPQNETQEPAQNAEAKEQPQNED